MGPRLPARLLPARRRGALRGRAGAGGVDGDGDDAGGRRHRGAAGPARPGRGHTGFERPNLSFAVIPSRTPSDKARRLASVLSDPEARPAIVYAGTREASDALAQELRAALGVKVVVYHAGLGRAERAEAQRRFMSDEAEVVVATNAFGMGVDKADVRTVAHATVPSSLEAYYQEAGRGGRDGKPAKALLFASQRDKGLHVFFIERARLDDNAYGAVARVIERAAEEDGRYDVGMAELMRVAGPRDPRAATKRPRRARPPRARGRDPAHAVAPRPGRRHAGRALRRARDRDLPHGGERDREGALARVPHDVALRRGGRVPPGDDPAPLRRPVRSGAERPVLRRLRSRWRAADGAARVVPRVSAKRAANGGDGAPVGDLDGGDPRHRRQRVALGRAHAGGGDPPRRALQGRSATTPTTGCPATAPTAT